MNEKLMRALAAIAVAILLVGLVLTGCQPAPEEPVARSYQCDVYTEQGCAKFIVASGGELEVQSGGVLDVQSGASMSIPGGYPLNYATTGYELVCGTSGTFTATTGIAVTELTTITYAVATQITDPAATGAYLTVDVPTTSTLTINSWEPDATVGTTGVNVYYCAVGNK